MDNRVKEAKKKYEAACKALIAMVREVYPVGTRLMVRLGGCDIEVEVTGHSDSWWHSPGEIFGINIHTGKSRSFHASQIIGD
jgi:hypothetical protein